MRSRLARFGVLLVAAVGLVAGTTSPANAHTVGALVIQGTAFVGAGLSYPCAPPAVGDIPPDKCPDGVGTGQGLVTPTKQKVSHPFPTGGNTATVTFSGTGAGVVVKVQKPKCPGVCVEAGTVTITASGFVTGWCGLSWGKLTQGTIMPDISVGTKANTRTIPATPGIQFLGVGGFLVVTGNVRQADGEEQYVAGTVLAVPNVAQNASCLNKNAKQFLVAGPIAIIGKNLLP